MTSTAEQWQNIGGQQASPHGPSVVLPIGLTAVQSGSIAQIHSPHQMQPPIQTRLDHASYQHSRHSPYPPASTVRSNSQLHQQISAHHISPKIVILFSSFKTKCIYFIEIELLFFIVFSSLFF